MILLITAVTLATPVIVNVCQKKVRAAGTITQPLVILGTISMLKLVEAAGIEANPAVWTEMDRTGTL